MYVSIHPNSDYSLWSIIGQKYVNKSKLDTSSKTAFQKSCTHSKIPTTKPGECLSHKILWEFYITILKFLIFGKLKLREEGRKREKTEKKSPHKTENATFEENTQGAIKKKKTTMSKLVQMLTVTV